MRLLLWAVFLTAAGCSSNDRPPQQDYADTSLANVEHVQLVRKGDGWDVSVTVRHEDTGWDHYADWWRITNQSGRELVRRVLRHPHVEEQPFTRSLHGVQLPPDLKTVVVEAHCLVHGTGGRTITVHLEQDRGPGFTIQR